MGEKDSWTALKGLPMTWESLGFSKMSGMV